MTGFWELKMYDLYLLGLPAILFILIYIYLDRTYSYWTRRGVPQVNPTSYIYGNVKNMFYGKEFGGVGYQKIYNELKGHPAGGFYEFINPVLMVRDPDLIQTVLVEKFKYFQDNKFRYELNNPDDSAGTHPFFTSGARWKEVRSVINPGFTPNKLRNLEDIVQSVYKDASKYLEKNNMENIEVHELTAKFMSEVVANWGWGIHANSFSENSVIRNIFDKMDFSSVTSSLLFNIWAFWPRIGNILNRRFFSKDLNNCLEHITEQAMKNPDKNSFLHTILSKSEKYKDGAGKDFSVNEITGYMATYYIDGYETTILLLDLVLYQLALFSDVQQKLRDEIMSSTETTVDIANKMEYMEMVISVGRYISAVAYLGRICTEKTTLGSIDIEQGTSILIPAYAIHHDPEYYPDPYNFNPENFSEENKKKRHKFTYMPFGQGPRICLGMRHSLTTIKLLLCYLLKEYEILPAKDKIAEPLKPKNEVLLVFYPTTTPVVRFKKLND
ncbi:cytochrome P450 6k1-like isoform X2 [Lycorma delicatula]|uniref:cytochrome P450 6k1-like isoform X2 n=1 Tax=Lycorma delicatula TaxID=130591 RepID=UPI003F511AAF